MKIKKIKNKKTKDINYHGKFHLCLVHSLKHIFLVFKQHYSISTHFFTHTYFHTCFQFLNVYTKHYLELKFTIEINPNSQSIKIQSKVDQQVDFNWLKVDWDVVEIPNLTWTNSWTLSYAFNYVVFLFFMRLIM